MDERTAERLLYLHAIWAVIEQHAPALDQVLADEVDNARSLLDVNE